MTDRHVSNYRIGDLVAGGSMGRVFRAEHSILHRTDALKFLAPELVAERAAVERFLREARMLAGLTHENICTVHDIGQADDGSWYIAMDFYEGGTLKQRLADGPLDSLTALHFAQQTARGLDHAHRHGVVHRDIKPANLLLTNGDKVKIVDFGVARLLDGTRHTMEGALVGTFGYLAPEQTRGRDVTAAADIWSLGVVLYEMLAGRLPFTGESHGAQLYAIAHEEPETLPGLDSTLDRDCAGIIDRCLQKDPADRYPSAGHLAEALTSVLAAERPTDWVPPPPPPGPDIDDTKRRRHWWHRIRLQSAIVALVALLVILGWTFVPGWLTEKVDTSGAVVMPFSFIGSTGDAAALGHGLAWYVNDELTAYDDASDAFWIVPPGALQFYDVGDAKEARERMGAYRTVSGSGRVSGSTIDLRLLVVDHRNGKQHEEEFHDTTANLQTWQRDIVAWVAGTLDPQTVFAVDDTPRGRTTVPAAFPEYCRGMGYLYPGLEDGSVDADLALAHLSRAVAADSSFVRARGELGFRIWSRGFPNDEAATAAGIAELATAIRLDPSLPRNHFHEGSIALAEDDLEGARAAFERGLAVEPSNAVILLALTSVQVAADQKEEAYATFARSIAARPGYSPGHEKLAICMYGYAEYAEAEAVLRCVVEFAPRNPAGYNFLAATIWTDRHDDEAEDLFLASLAIKPSEWCLNNLGILYYYQTRYEDAALVFRRAVDMDPGNSKMWQNLAEAYRWSPGLEDSSRVVYEKALELGEADLRTNPTDMKLASVVASYHSLLGNEKRALELLELIEDQSDPRGRVALYMAVTYEDLGRREEALAYLERALDDDSARRMIEEYPGFRNLRSDERYRALIDRDR